MNFMVCGLKKLKNYAKVIIITLGHQKNDSSNQMIQISEMVSTLFWNIGTALNNYKKWLILSSVIRLSGGHCTSLKIAYN
jgi:hypothetical protein